MKNSFYWKLIALVFVGAIVFTQIFDLKFENKESGPALSLKLRSGLLGADKNKEEPQEPDQALLEEEILPLAGVVIPFKWGDLGKRMIEKGVIDSEKFESIYQLRGGLNNYEKALLYAENNDSIKIDKDNSGFILNLLWAFGLANKNPILEQGPMMDPKYGGAGRFASTGGWVIAKSDAMDYYSQYEFIKLTEEQQKLVEEVSKNIYRPCCGNSTYFPDCNHGLAMLGLLELLAAQGLSEEEMYKIALKVNSYWFPETYLTLAKYFEKRGVAWAEVEPKEVLGSVYSSASGYQEILKEIKPVSLPSGGCGV